MLTKFYRVLPSFTGFYSVLLDFTGFLSDFYRVYRVLPTLIECIEGKLVKLS